MATTHIVTGAAGFIGSKLSKALLGRGERVVGIDNFDPFYDRERKLANLDGLSSERFELIEADICDREAMREIFTRVRPDLVFNIAALAGVRPSIERPDRYTEVNVGGLTSILEAMRVCGCSRLAFASSSSVYGNNKKIPFAETDSVSEQISPYAATKRAAELICQTYCKVFDFSIASLRFFTVYGPSQRPDLAIGKFMRLIAAEEDIPMFGDGSTSRDYTYIDDIIDGVLAASDKIAAGEPGLHRIWNLGNSNPVKLSEMIESIGRVVGKVPQIKILPMQLGDVDRTYADVTRSKAELGYQPAIEFEEGLVRQWEWLRLQT